MWRLAALALLLCAGCEATDFYRADTHSWFATPHSPPALLGENETAPH